MSYKTKYLLATTAIMVCMLNASPSFSDTVTKKTVTEMSNGTTVQKTVTTDQSGIPMTETEWVTDPNSIPAVGAHKIGFSDFDLNKDNIVSTNEIGKSLFKYYDTDDNEKIDNNEYKQRIVVNATPVQKDTVVSYDFDGDGMADTTKYTYETFMQQTMLSRFDKNSNGLSPYEFTGRSFDDADINKNKEIDLKEWQGTYTASIDAANKSKANINN